MLPNWLVLPPSCIRKTKEGIFLEFLSQPTQNNAEGGNATSSALCLGPNIFLAFALSSCLLLDGMLSWTQSADIQNSDLNFGVEAKKTSRSSAGLRHWGPINQVQRIRVWSRLAQPLKLYMGVWNQHQIAIKCSFVCLFLCSIFHLFVFVLWVWVPVKNRIKALAMLCHG